MSSSKGGVKLDLIDPVIGQTYPTFCRRAGAFFSSDCELLPDVCGRDPWFNPREKKKCTSFQSRGSKKVLRTYEGNRLLVSSDCRTHKGTIPAYIIQWVVSPQLIYI